MEKKIIIITHAGMAAGVGETLEFILGNNDDIVVIQAFTEEKRPEQKVKELINTAGESCRIVILSDIEFGSVNQMCAKYMTDRIHLITGFNFPLVLELVTLPVEKINETHLLELIEKARVQIKYMNAAVRAADEGGEEEFF